MKTKPSFERRETFRQAVKAGIEIRLQARREVTGWVYIHGRDWKQQVFAEKGVVKCLDS